MSISAPARNPASPFASMVAHHVGFRVSDLDAALAWYAEKLDLRVVGRSGANGMTFTLLALPNDDGFCLELLHGPGAAAQPDVSDDLIGGLSVPGFNHVGLQLADVASSIAELKRRDVKILLEPFDNADLQLRVAFIADPWGNVIELIEQTQI